MTIIEPTDGPVIFNEAHWNNTSAALVEEKGSNAGGFHIYSASKTIAEKAAWKFVEDNKDQIKFDLSSIHPSYVSLPTERT